MMTATGTDGSAVKEEIVGIAFWREVPSEEMKDWMDLRRISKAIADKRLAAPVSSAANDEHDNKLLSRDARNALRLVRSDSVGWIKNALQPCDVDKSILHL